MIDLEHLIWDAFKAESWPMHPEHFADCMDHFARVELGGNDGADVWECTEFNRGMAACYGIEDDREWQKLLDEMQTWVMRAMGPSYDPEKHCPYTGRRLWKCPIQDHLGIHNMIGYFREPNAYLFRCRPMDAGELQWVARNPEAMKASLAKFNAWRDKCRLAGG